MKKTLFLIILFISLFTIWAILSCEQSAQPIEDKAEKIANWIQEKVNMGGYTGCTARVIERGNPGVVQCDLRFPAGTDTLTVRMNVKGVAESFAQAGRLASTIYYAGYSGSQSICEYKYDCYTGRVTEKY